MGHARCLTNLGRESEAVDLLKETRAGYARLVGEDHPWTLQADRFLSQIASARPVTLPGDP